MTKAIRVYVHFAYDTVRDCYPGANHRAALVTLKDLRASHELVAVGCEEGAMVAHFLY